MSEYRMQFKKEGTAAWISRHTSTVTHWSARPQRHTSSWSTQLTGARLPSSTRRISPTVYSSGERVRR